MPDLYQAHADMKKILKNAFESFHAERKMGETMHVGIDGFGATENDTEIRADQILRGLIEAQLQQFPWVKAFHVEGGKLVTLRETGYTVWVDPADGSQNIHYQMPLLGSGTLPFCCAYSLFDDKEHITFGDCVSGGVQDLRPGQKGVCFSFLQNDSARLGETMLHTIKDPTADPKQHIIFVDFYYPWDRHFAAEVFPEKGGLRSLGCAVMEMMMVAAGSAAAFICLQQKADILGVGYGMIKAAGGTGFNLLTGESLDKEPVGPLTEKIPVALCANESIAEDLKKRIETTKVLPRQQRGILSMRSDFMAKFNLERTDNRIISLS